MTLPTTLGLAPRRPVSAPVPRFPGGPDPVVFGPHRYWCGEDSSKEGT